MSSRTVEDLMMRLVRVEERVKSLMTWQKWQMALLASILMAVFLKRP